MTQTRHLFVYGSLLSAVGHPNGKRLMRDGRLVGAAALTGRLFAISWYPGAVEPDPSDSAAGVDRHATARPEIRGEVYLLNDPDAALAWLDAYEGIDASGGPPGEFFRATRPVRLEDGSEMAAWAYLYRGSVDGLTVIPSGYWPDHQP